MRTYEDIAKEMLELRDVVRKLTDERDEARKKVRDMSTTEPPIERIRTLRATVAKLTEERDALKQAYLNVADERSQLRAQLAERDAMVAALRDELQEASNEIVRLDPHIQHPQGTGYDAGHILANTAQAAAAHDERVRAEVLEPIRRALSSAGYCGDGNVTEMVTRALKEAEHKLPDETVACLLALDKANDVVNNLDPDAEGTLAERILHLSERVRAEERRRIVAELTRR